MVKRVRKAILWSLLFGVLLSLPAAVMGQALPAPANFVKYLDVRCYQIPNQPPLGVPLHLDHLNPVFQQKGIPPKDVVLGPPQDLCVPVQKNDYRPTPDVLPFIQFVDWKCYAISGPSLDLPLHLDHLNPVISGMFGPSDDVVVREPQQLCVPVAKNGRIPSPDILPIIQYSDVLCYQMKGLPLNYQLRLTHLNPVLIAMGLPDEFVPVTETDKLCVPVAKNGNFPPGGSGGPVATATP